VAKRTPSAKQDLPDDELMIEVMNGIDASFEQLVNRHQERLARVATKILGRAADAEDAVQLAFLHLFSHRHSYQPRGKLRSLILKMTVNECLQILRQRGPFVPLVDAETFVCSNPSQETTVLLGRIVRAGLATLSEEELHVVVLHDCEGLTFDEIGAELDVPPGTLRRWHGEALASLIAWWKEAEAGPAPVSGDASSGPPVDAAFSRYGSAEEERVLTDIAHLFDLLGSRKLRGES